MVKKKELKKPRKLPIPRSEKEIIKLLKEIKDSLEFLCNDIKRQR